MTPNQLRDRLIAVLGPDATILGPERVDQLAEMIQEAYARGGRDMEQMIERTRLGPVTPPGIKARGNKGIIGKTIELKQQIDDARYVVVQDNHRRINTHEKRLDRLDELVDRILDGIVASTGTWRFLCEEWMKRKRPDAERNASGRSEEAHRVKGSGETTTP